MARLIEIDGPHSGVISMETGDLLVFSATGGRLVSGFGVLEMMGPFYPGIITGTGEIIVPEGSPNKVMFLARQPGIAKIETFWGDSWNAPKSVSSQVRVSELFH